ncbi:hypothetical protein Tco_1137293, partial [Tanacetum coccineum]
MCHSPSLAAPPSPPAASSPSHHQGCVGFTVHRTKGAFGLYLSGPVWFRDSPMGHWVRSQPIRAVRVRLAAVTAVRVRLVYHRRHRIGDDDSDPGSDDDSDPGSDDDSDPGSDDGSDDYSDPGCDDDSDP